MDYKPFEHDRVNMQGGKILTPKEINRAIRKKFVKPAGQFFNKAGSELGKFTNEQLLPAVTTIGIPLASEALGMLGAEAGIPPQLTSALSSNIMKEFIPKQYQSKNKYVGLISDALSAGMSDNPMDAMNVMNKTIGTVSSDIMGKPKPKPLPIDPQNPYNSQIEQILSMYEQQPQTQEIQPTEQAKLPNNEGVEPADALSHEGQKKGSVNGLLGLGIKKKKRKSKSKKEVVKVEIVKPRKFTHAKNPALEQLLDASKEREEKSDRDEMREMVKKHTNALRALGFGIDKERRIRLK